MRLLLRFCAFACRGLHPVSVLLHCNHSVVVILLISVKLFQNRYSHTNSIFFHCCAIFEFCEPFSVFCFFACSVLYVFSLLIHSAPGAVGTLSILVAVVQSRYSHTNSNLWLNVSISVRSVLVSFAHSPPRDVCVITTFVLLLLLMFSLPQELF